MLIVMVVGLVWIALSVVVVAACRVAALCDAFGGECVPLGEDVDSPWRADEALAA